MAFRLTAFKFAKHFRSFVCISLHFPSLYSINTMPFFVKLCTMFALLFSLLSLFQKH